MRYKTKYQFISIGEKIRELRKGNQDTKSQEAFIDVLKEQYDFPISRNTLSRIENGDMTAFSLDFLLCVCDLFNCDIGYLLGEYEEATAAANKICEITGLSEKAVEKLHEISLKNNITANSDTLSTLIEDEDFKYFLALLSAKMCYDNNSLKTIETGNARIEIKTSAITNYEIERSISEISSKMKSKFSEKYKTVDERETYLFCQKMCGFAYGLLKENRITEQEYNIIIAEYKKGNFEYELGRKI